MSFCEMELPGKGFVFRFRKKRYIISLKILTPIVKTLIYTKVDLPLNSDTKLHIVSTFHPSCKILAKIYPQCPLDVG